MLTEATRKDTAGQGQGESRGTLVKMLLEQRPDRSEAVSLASIRGRGQALRLGAGEGHEGLWDSRGRSRGGLDLGGSEPLAFSR